MSISELIKSYNDALIFSRLGVDSMEWTAWSGQHGVDGMKWEYIVREFEVEDSGKILLMEDFLNEVGRDGWELVSVATTPTAGFTHLVYLKRSASAITMTSLSDI
jgi:hypothetical protein